MRLRPARAVIAALVLAAAVAPAAADLRAANAAYSKLLARHVTPRGVRYDAWRFNGDDLKMLAEILAVFRSTDPRSLDGPERFALYINLYNAKVIETVLLGQPKQTIKDLSKPLKPTEIFSRKVMLFDGKSTSLEDLEKRLRLESRDPRIHFALCGAARSCPPVRSEAYEGARLDAQLDAAVRDFLAMPGVVDVRRRGGDATIVTSRVFDWYASDFKQTGGVLAFLQKYAPEDASSAIAAGRVRIEHYDYDWSLNALK